MFESYLGICVLPSETWTCDTNFKEKQNTGESIKNYLDFNSDHLDLSETLDSSYSLNDETFDNKDINPVTNFLNQKFSLFATNEVNQKIEKNNSIETKNFPKFDKKITVNNIVLLNYFITNYIIRNNNVNKKNIKEIEKTRRNETKYKIANTKEEKQKVTIIDNLNQSVINKNITEMENIFKKNNKNNSPLIEMKNVCKTIGNIVDPNSSSHYYLCYSNNGKTRDLASVRMMCPKNLIFCAEKKICTRQRICRKNLSNKKFK